MMVCENAARRRRGDMKNRHYGGFAWFENTETQSGPASPGGARREFKGDSKIGSSLFSMAENNRKLTAKNAKSAGNNPVFL
jgi:hypothetical protein